MTNQIRQSITGPFIITYRTEILSTLDGNKRKKKKRKNHKKIIILPP